MADGNIGDVSVEKAEPLQPAFSVAEAQALAQKLAEVRLKLPKLNDTHENGADEAAREQATAQLNGIATWLQSLHSHIVMEGFENDPEMNWQYGRLLHNMGRPEDALFYLERAHELAPDNNKVLGRLAEVYLDLHEEVRSVRYDVSALEAATTLIQRESSEYAREVHGLASAYVWEREQAEGLFTLLKINP